MLQRYIAIIGSAFILVASLYFFCEKIWLPKYITEHFEETLQFPVTIKSIKPRFGKIDIENFIILNPSFFRLPYAFKVSWIAITAPFIRYFKNQINVEKLEIDEVYIGLELRSVGASYGNWGLLIQNASKFAKKSGQANKQVRIDKLCLRKISIEIFYPSKNKSRLLPIIPYIEIQNIDSEGGRFTDQLMHTALGRMIKEIFIQEHLENILDKIFNFPQKVLPLPEVMNPLKKWVP